MAETITNILYWIFFLVSGFLILKYRRQIRQFSGKFAWAEIYLWRWWTYLVILVAWLLLIFLWAVFPFWWMDIILRK